LRGVIDVFCIDTLDLGELKQIVIGHDGTGIGAGWFCDKIFIVNEGTNQVVCSHARNDWIPAKETRK